MRERERRGVEGGWRRKESEGIGRESEKVSLPLLATTTKMCAIVERNSSKSSSGNSGSGRCNSSSYSS